jgi:hypothetical protein
MAAIMHETARAYSYLAQYDSAIALRRSTYIEQSIEGGTSSKEFANNITGQASGWPANTTVPGSS